MQWTVLFDPDFEQWLLEQVSGVRRSILANVEKLGDFGPTLGRPLVDTLKGSKVANLKELRVQYQGDPWRVLFVFDPKRRVILLVGGNKQNDKRWYKENIAIAEQRYKRHLENLELEKEDGENF